MRASRLPLEVVFFLSTFNNSSFLFVFSFIVQVFPFVILHWPILAMVQSNLIPRVKFPIQAPLIALKRIPTGDCIYISYCILLSATVSLTVSICLPDRSNTQGGANGNSSSNTPPPMASHRQDNSKLLAPPDPQFLVHSEPNSRMRNAYVHARVDSHAVAFQQENRRSKLAKTGNFYIKNSLKPLSSDVIIGEWLENIISTHSPRVSPTENSRPSSLAFGVHDPFLVTQPWITESGEKIERSRSDPTLSDSALSDPSLAYLSLTGTQPTEPAQIGHGQVEPALPGIGTSHRHPYLDAASPQWCKVVNELFSTEFEYPEVRNFYT
jgi:hypothetical protein